MGLIRNCVPNDVRRIHAIYSYYVENTAFCLEEAPVLVETIMDRVQRYQKRYPWLVYEENDQILGYAYATQWKERTGYRHTAEVSVYVDKDARGCGIGKALYKKLLEEIAASCDCHVFIAGICLPNDASVVLHEHLGFEKVAHFKEVGRKFGTWVDVGMWQKFVKRK